MKLDWAAASDTGQVRANNQDSAVAEDGLFAVADGMGGHAAGEVASRVAVEALRVSAEGNGLVEAVRAANQAVIDRADTDPALRGMGTTMVAIAREGEQVVMVNVGDSRGYLFRDGQLQQITEDHNLVAQLLREGRLTREEARVHPQRNIITRVLGNDPDVEIDVFTVDAFRGDRFLLCSDGLFNEVDDDAVADVLRNHRDPQAVADELVRRANAGGGRDNITVVVVDVLDDNDRSRAASVALAGAAATSVAEPIPAAPTESARRARRADDSISVEPPRPRWVTWRSVLFALAMLLVIGSIAGSFWWFGRNTFYVGVDGDQVAIFRGRPSGLLWLDPTVEQRTTLTLSDVPAARRDDVEKGKDQADLATARRYVVNLRQQAAEERAATTPTSSSTTTTTAPSPGTPTTTTSTP
ncbi:MAG: serine/threonine protein phosphatase [Acidimicrobiales bacterium]|nr:serine/threonine protein phosphatase [Acidimicrobiales bacterium]